MMIAYRSHRYDCRHGDVLEGPVYSFTQRATAEWYRKRYMDGQGTIIKIDGVNPRTHKDHPDQRIFDEATILQILE